MKRILGIKQNKVNINTLGNVKKYLEISIIRDWSQYYYIVTIYEFNQIIRDNFKIKYIHYDSKKIRNKKQ